MKKAFLVYGIAYLTLLTIVVGLLYAYPKQELHLLLNSYHTSIQDTFFKYYSMLAEGPLYVVALLPIFWKKIKLTVFFALCELTGGGVLQVLKHIISMPRPLSVFENCPDMVLPVVDGVNMHAGNSFPSGHASTFFVFCTCCVLFLAYRYRQKGSHSRAAWIHFALAVTALLAMAALGAYSRVYLSQHFLSDVCVGSIIGFITPCLMFFLIGKRVLKLKMSELR